VRRRVLNASVGLRLSQRRQVPGVGTGERGGTRFELGEKGFAILCLTTCHLRQPGEQTPLNRNSYQPLHALPVLLVLTTATARQISLLRLIRAHGRRRPDIQVLVLPLVGRGIGLQGA